MRLLLAWLSVAASFSVIACGGATATIDDGGPTDDGSVNDGAVSDGSAGDASTNDGGVVTDDGGGVLDAGGPDSSTTCNGQTVNFTIGNCPSAPTCGGTIADGIYAYTVGCLPDPWAQMKQACSTLKVTNEKGTVKGCVTFSGGTIARDVATAYSASLGVPMSCLFGSSCAQLQTNLANYFTTATCKPSTTNGCNCDVSSTYAGTTSTSYTTTNSQLVTGANNHYDYCAAGSSLGLEWVSGPNVESGNYTLTKQ